MTATTTHPAPSRTWTSNSRKAGLIAILCAIVGLSIGSTMVKKTGSPGPVVAVWRLSIGALVWQIVLLVRKQRFTVEHAKITLLPGVLFGINLMFFFTGVTRTRIANAEFIGTLTPLIVLPFAAYRLKEKIRREILLFGVLALGGVSLIVLLGSKGGAHSWSGDLLCIGAVTTWACYLLFTKRIRSRIDTTRFMAGMTLFAALTVAPFAVGTGHLTQVTHTGWVLIAVMAVTSGVVSHGLLAWSQQSVPVSTMSLLQLGQPGLSTFWAWLILDEAVKPLQIIGMAVVLFAVGNIARIATRPVVREPNSPTVARPAPDRI